MTEDDYTDCLDTATARIIDERYVLLYEQVVRVL